MLRFLIASLFLTTAVSAQIHAPGSITLYEHADYQGASYRINLANVARNQPLNLPSSWLNRTSSIKWSLGTNITAIFFTCRNAGCGMYHIGRQVPRRSGVARLNNHGLNDLFGSYLWSYQDPNKGTVYGHEHRDSTGQYDVLPLSSFREGSLHRIYHVNDKISSLSWSSLPKNVVVTFYEHVDGSGRQWTIDHMEARSGKKSWVGSFLNDRFSAFRWYTIDPNQGFFEMWEHADFSGYKLIRYHETTPDHRLYKLSGISFDNEIGAVRWNLPAGQSVIFFDGAAASNAAFSVRGSGRFDLRNQKSGMFNNRISSFKYYHHVDYGPEFANRDVPIDENTFLCSHNSAVSAAHGFLYFNQSKSVRWQLDYGVRHLQLDSLLHNGRLYSVHGTWSETKLARVGATNPQLLSTVLNQIKAWLDTHKDEVIFLNFEHQKGNGTGKELGNYLLANSPIRNLIHVQKTGSYLTINEQVKTGKRVFVFITREGNHPTLNWDADWVCANHYDKLDTTRLKPGSKSINNLWRGLFRMNRIRPVAGGVFSHDNTKSKLVTLAGRFTQVPNFINIDMVQDGDHAGLRAARALNSQRNSNRVNGRRQGRAIIFSEPCRSTNLSVTQIPKIGGNLALSFSNSFRGLLALGLSDRTIGGAPLPMQLGNCQLRVDPLILIPISSYSRSFSSGIPNDRSLAGRNAFFQASWATGSLSNGCRVVIGN